MWAVRRFICDSLSRARPEAPRGYSPAARLAGPSTLALKLLQHHCKTGACEGTQLCLLAHAAPRRRSQHWRLFLPGGQTVQRSLIAVQVSVHHVFPRCDGIICAVHDCGCTRCLDGDAGRVVAGSPATCITEVLGCCLPVSSAVPGSLITSKTYQFRPLGKRGSIADAQLGHS